MDNGERIVEQPIEESPVTAAAFEASLATGVTTRRGTMSRGHLETME